MRHWSEDDLNAVRQRLNQLNHNSRPVRPKRSKYGNVKTYWQGQVFDSKHELADWKVFEQQRMLGAIRAVIRQVSMPLPGTRRRIRVDFLVVDNDGRQRWFDSKGHETAVSKLKRDQIREAYGITIETI